MSTDNANHQDLITNVADAFERMPIPPGPSVQETIDRIKRGTSVRAAMNTGPSSRRRLMRILTPLAAAAAVGVVLVVTLWSSGNGSLAFAQVIEQLEKIDAVGFTLTISAPGRPEMSGKGYALSPNLIRVDWKVGDRSMINITDHATGELIALDPASQQATVHKLPPSHDFDVVRRLRETDDKQAHRIEPQGEHDSQTEVFEIRDGSAIGKVWVDAMTKLPVRYEMQGPEGSELGGAVFTDFDWNPAIDRTLFEIPAGYTRTENTLLTEPTEDELVQALRIRNAFTDEPYAADFLTDEPGLTIGRAAYDHTLSREQNHARQLERLGPMLDALGLTPEAAQDAKQLQQRIDFLCMKADQMAMTILGTGGWVGGGVRGGEADKPLCWWRPRGSDQFRVLYGDLTVRDATTAPTGQ